MLFNNSMLIGDITKLRVGAIQSTELEQILRLDEGRSTLRFKNIAAANIPNERDRDDSSLEYDDEESEDVTEEAQPK